MIYRFWSLLSLIENDHRRSGSTVVIPGNWPVPFLSSGVPNLDFNNCVINFDNFACKFHAHSLSDIGFFW